MKEALTARQQCQRVLIAGPAAPRIAGVGSSSCGLRCMGCVRIGGSAEGVGYRYCGQSPQLPGRARRLGRGNRGCVTPGPSGWPRVSADFSEGLRRLRVVFTGFFQGDGQTYCSWPCFWCGEVVSLQAEHFRRHPTRDNLAQATCFRCQALPSPRPADSAGRIFLRRFYVYVEPTVYYRMFNTGPYDKGMSSSCFALRMLRSLFWEPYKHGVPRTGGTDF